MSGHLPPPSNTPLVGLPAASLDFETTGLDVRQDRITQIGIVMMTGGRIHDTPQINQMINPGIPIPPTAERITGISDADVADAPPLAEYFEQLREALSGRVVVGHHIAFDLAVLRHEAARLGVEWSDPPALDLAELIGAMVPSLPDLGLETVAGHLGVTIGKRHDALGDAMAVAECLARLMPELRNADIRTLGEVRSLAAQRQDLAVRRAEAGWESVPGETARKAEARPTARVDSYVFSRRLREVMKSPAAFVSGDTALLAAAQTMIAKRIGALVIGDPDRPPDGILTERDLLRAFAGGELDGGTDPVTTVMSSPVETMDGHELLYRGLGRMDAKGIRHLCITDTRGIVVGMVSQRDLLHHRARFETLIDDELEEAADAAHLAMAYHRVPHVAEALMSEGLGGVEVARVVARELRAVTARAAELAIQQMTKDGRGEPPAPWSLMVLGSGGRGESLLSSDQDNALIHTGTDADDPWFADFGTLVADILDEVGVPRCIGGVMAANPPWRGTEAVWRDRVENWVQRARPEDLLNVDIFFDLRPVAGDADLGNQLIEEATIGASRSRAFLGLMGQSVEQVAPRFGLFGKPKVEEGRIDLKRDGLLPLVSLARALALRAASTARSTPDRIAEAAQAERIGERDAKVLIETHRQLLGLILRQQLIDMHDGVRPSSRVEVKQLDKEERGLLKEHLNALDDIVRGVRSMMT